MIDSGSFPIGSRVKIVSHHPYYNECGKVVEVFKDKRLIQFDNHKTPLWCFMMEMAFEHHPMPDFNLDTIPNIKYEVEDGVSYAVFYFGEDDSIGRSGEVRTKNGRIIAARITTTDEPSDWFEMTRSNIKEQGFSRITFQIPATANVV